MPSSLCTAAILEKMKEKKKRQQTRRVKTKGKRRYCDEAEYFLRTLVSHSSHYFPSTLPRLSNTNSLVKQTDNMTEAVSLT